MKTLLYLLFFFATPLLAQKNKKLSKFRVLVEQGELYQFQKSSFSKTKQEKVLAGSPIFKKIVIVLKSNDYLILADTLGNMLEFSQEKNIDIDSLEQHYKPQERTWGKKYNSYIFTDLINASKIDFSKNNQRYILGDALPVYRGNCRCLPSTADIYLPQKSPKEDLIHYLFNKDSLTLRLYPNPAIDRKNFTYQIIISDFYGKNVYKNTFVASPNNQEALIHMDIAKLLKTSKGDDFIINATIVEFREPLKEQITYSFQIVDDQKRQSILMLEPTTSLSPQTTFDNLYLIYFYEKNGYTVDALRHFELLIAQRPNVESFKVLYEDFKVKYQMRSFLAKKNTADKYASYYYQTIIPTENDHLKLKYLKTQQP